MTAITARLNDFELRLQGMERELHELRRLASAPAPEHEPEPELPLWVISEPAPVFEPPAPRAPRPRRELDLSALLGARALAWTGGTVMLLGIVFFFVLAMERGWIGPVARVSLGAAASALCLGAGVWLHRRFGDTYASVSAAGAGIAGLYATLLAATALYDLVPRPAALATAAAIAATGAALALLWSTQTLAAIGLLGAVVIPLPIALQDGHLSPVGTAFAVLVLAAAIGVTVPRRWRALQAATTAVATVETFALVLAHEPRATAVAIALWLIAGLGAVWPMLRERVSYFTAWLLVLDAMFAGWSADVLYHGDARGYALLVAAGAYGVVSVVLWRRDRDSASILWGVALTVSAVAAAVLVSGVTLTVVWAAEAALLARLARRLGEPRFQLGSLAWLVLAYAHGIGVDAPLSKLFVANDDTWAAALSAAALAAGTAVVGLSTFDWVERSEGIFTRVFTDLRRAQRGLRVAAFAVAGTAALYAASLFLVTVPSSWDWGHVAVAGLWAAGAVVLVFTPVRVASFAASAVASLLVLLYDLPHVAEPQRWWAFAVVGGAAAVVATVNERRSRYGAVELPSLLALIVSVGLSTAAVYGLLDGNARGVALLALAAAYGAVGVALLQSRRDFASALGAAALLLAVPASVILLDRTWLVLAWTAAAASLALLARYEDRLLHGALAYFGLAFAHVLGFEAQPANLFVAHRHPGTGVPALLLLVAAVAVLSLRSEQLRGALMWVGGALALYAATLGILELFEDGGAGVTTAFQRGHTAVSALWGMVGLILLVAGLKRGGRRLQIGGFVLFGVSLAKLFLFDLAFLSSVARAGSFLAVGAVLLVGGFFYQRLAADGPKLDSPA